MITTDVVISTTYLIPTLQVVGNIRRRHDGFHDHGCFELIGLVQVGVARRVTSRGVLLQSFARQIHGTPYAESHAKAASAAAVLAGRRYLLHRRQAALKFGRKDFVFLQELDGSPASPACQRIDAQHLGTDRASVAVSRSITHEILLVAVVDLVFVLEAVKHGNFWTDGGEATAVRWANASHSAARGNGGDVLIDGRLGRFRVTVRDGHLVATGFFRYFAGIQLVLELAFHRFERLSKGFLEFGLAELRALGTGNVRVEDEINDHLAKVPVGVRIQLILTFQAKQRLAQQLVLGLKQRGKAHVEGPLLRDALIVVEDGQGIVFLLQLSVGNALVFDVVNESGKQHGQMSEGVLAESVRFDLAGVGLQHHVDELVDGQENVKGVLAAVVRCVVVARQNGARVVPELIDELWSDPGSVGAPRLAFQEDGATDRAGAQVRKDWLLLLGIAVRVLLLFLYQHGDRAHQQQGRDALHHAVKQLLLGIPQLGVRKLVVETEAFPIGAGERQGTRRVREILCAFGCRHVDGLFEWMECCFFLLSSLAKPTSRPKAARLL